MSSFYLGIDLGGTNVKAGVVDSTGRLITKVSLPTGTSGTDLAAAVVIKRMVAAGNQAIEEAGVRRDDLAAVGVLSPGQASLARGIVFRSANLPLWKNVPLRAKVGKALRLPAVLENDANAAAFGEWWAGAGRKTKGKSLDNLFMFTLGTGVGGGLVYQGQVVRGSFDFATEVGHMIMIPGGDKCGCGQHGCLERYCSAKYSVLRPVAALSCSKILLKKSSLGRLFREKGSLVSPDIARHAKAGDPFALESWNETCRILALACINVSHFIDPQMIVLGGGMSGAGEHLLDNVNRYYRALWWKMTKPTARIVLAKLGNDAGIIGAAGVAKDAYDRHALPPIGR